MIQRLDTPKIIFQSLVDLSRKMSVDKITVGDIMKNCGYKRETFYYYYRSKEDLIISALQDNTQKIHETYSKNKTWELLMLKNLEFCYEHRQLMIWLNQNSNRFEVDLRDFMVNYVCHMILKDKIPQSDFSQMGEIRFYCGGASSIFEYWITNHFKESKEEIAALIAAQLPLVLKTAMKTAEEN